MALFTRAEGKTAETEDVEPDDRVRAFRSKSASRDEATKPAAAAPVAETKKAPSGHRSWALTWVAYGFFAFEIAINYWASRTAGGDWLDMGIPMAWGVLVGAALFFLPAKMQSLGPGRRGLAITVYCIVLAFALTNSLRMASLVAVDQAAFRGDRQTAGIEASTKALETARAQRNRACRSRQENSVACRQAQNDVAMQERAATAASTKIQGTGKPENADFSQLVSWVSRGNVQPGARCQQGARWRPRRKGQGSGGVSRAAEIARARDALLAGLETADFLSDSDERLRLLNLDLILRLDCNYSTMLLVADEALDTWRRLEEIAAQGRKRGLGN
jgi:hypothetical protein